MTQDLGSIHFNRAFCVTERGRSVTQDLDLDPGTCILAVRVQCKREVAIQA